MIYIHPAISGKPNHIKALESSTGHRAEVRSGNAVLVATTARQQARDVLARLRDSDRPTPPTAA